MKSSKLNNETVGVIIKTLGNLPYNVLWKFEEELPGKPKNVEIRKWFPQQDVLGDVVFIFILFM